MRKKKMTFDDPESLMEQMARDTAKEIQEQIDFVIIADMLVEMGWKRLHFEPLRGVEEAYDISAWIRANCKGKVKSRGDTWLFENEKDAAWFTLRWSELADG